MITRAKKACVAAALIVPSCLFSISAGAQSLALSYKLDVNSNAAQPAPAVSRCAGFNWVTSIGACGRDLLARVSAASRVDSDSPQRADALAIFEPTVPNSELPSLGTPVPESLLRSAGGKESPIGNSKAVDLLFRFGSKYRLRSADEGWEWYRFTDVAYETRRQNSMHKAVGVELLVPFQ